MVVDDDVGMNTAIQRLLHAAGYTTSTFSSAEALLATNEAEICACLILDIHLPGISGFDLAKQIRQQGLQTPVIFITAYDTEDFYSRSKEVGAIASMTKPFPGEKLLSEINLALINQDKLL